MDIGISVTLTYFATIIFSKNDNFWNHPTTLWPYFLSFLNQADSRYNYPIKTEKSLVFFKYADLWIYENTSVIDKHATLIYSSY